MQSEGAFSVQGTIDEVDRAIRGSPDPARALLDLTIGAVREDNPTLAEAIRYCAIPRRLDAQIVGVLRDAPGDRATNEKLLTGLASLHLVTPRSDNAYVYHDRRRTLLLEYWRSDAEKGAQFDRFNQRLVTFYEAQHNGAQELEHDLERVKAVLLNANGNRYTQVASAVRQRVLAPLFEALYHETLRSAEAGYSLFSRYCEAYEARGLLTICDSLRKAARDNLQGLPAGSNQEGPLKWLEYWEARILRSYRRNSEAEKILRELLPKAAGDTKLKLWTLGDLGNSLHEQNKLREASEVYQMELALAKETQQDPYNLPVSYSRVAGLHWSLGELDQAATRFREAIASARGQGNSRMEAFALLNLGGVLQDRGEWSEALNAALEGVHLARAQTSKDWGIEQAAASRLMFLTGRRDPGLLDTLFKEAFALSGEGILALDLRNQYVNLLQSSGQLDRAEQVLGELLKEAAEQINTSFGVELLFRRALLQEARGRLAEAVAQYDDVIRASQESHGNIWHIAAALSNQALLNATCARWTEAESASHRALQHWQNIGHEKLAALVRVVSANAQRRQGRLAEAQKLLDDAAIAFEGSQASYWADFHRTQADVYRDQAQWAKAGDHYHQAASFNRSVDQIKQAAQDFGDLTVTASSQGHWEKAVGYAAEAHELWRQMAVFEHYQPTEQVEAADEANGEGVSHFFAIGENRRRNLERARESFRTASAKTPNAFWYLLNLAHASADLEDWRDAAQAVDKALQCAPPWFQSPVLYDWLAEYRLKQAATQFQAGHFKEAQQTYSEGQALLRGRVGLDRWLRIVLGSGDSWLKLEEWGKARAEYESGLDAATKAGDLTNQTIFQVRLGFRAACLADLQEAVEHIKAAVLLRKDAEATTSDLVACSHLVSSLRQYHGFTQAMRVLEADPELSSERRRLLAARLEISRERYRRVLRPLATASQAELSSRIPVPTPIALEADARLFPEGPNKPQDQLVDVELPAMRKRIESSTGVKIPGVRIRSDENQLGEGGYALVLNDVPRVFATVYAAEKYCPDAAACERIGILGRPSVNPWDGKRGMWLPDSAAAQASSAQLTLFDAYQYMVAHLEWFVRCNLGALVGVQEVHEMLERWAKDQKERRDLLERTLADTELRVRFTHVLQGLIREGVPIGDITTILMEFATASTSLSSASEIAERVRPALRAVLPGNDGKRQRMALSDEFESVVGLSVREREGKRFLAIAPAVAQNLLSELRARLGGVEQEDAALVVRQPGLRPFMRRLIESEFPWLPVLAEHELAPGLAPLAAQVEYEGPYTARTQQTV